MNKIISILLITMLPFNIFAYEVESNKGNQNQSVQTYQQPNAFDQMKKTEKSNSSIYYIGATFLAAGGIWTSFQSFNYFSFGISDKGALWLVPTFCLLAGAWLLFQTGRDKEQEYSQIYQMQNKFSNYEFKSMLDENMIVKVNLLKIKM